MPARKNKGTKHAPWSEETRSRIQTSMILNRLSDHVAGKVEMSTSQVTAALGLLRKAMPDLSAQDISIKGDWQTSITELIEKLDEFETDRKSKQSQGVSLH